MTETAQARPSMMDAFRSTWDTCELFAQLRRHAPIMHVPEVDAWVLSRYDDILPIIQDVDHFGCMPDDLVGEVPDELKSALPHGYAPWQPALVNTDPPQHTRIRKLATKALTPNAVRAREGAIKEAADGLLDAIQPEGHGDLMDRFATPMPVHVLIRILGVPAEDHQKFHEWTLGITELFVPTISEQRRLYLAREQVDFSDYLMDAITQRRRSPSDDLISGLILAQEDTEKSLTDREILGVVGQLVIAGFETSAGGIGFALYKLCEDRELLNRVRSDLSLVPKVVEESLRRLTPARGIVRRVKKDVEIRGHQIPKGTNLFLLVQSANNDDSEFEDPAKFNIDRDAAEMRKSVHFGLGPHNCIGKWVARLDMRVAIETAITRLPNLRLAPQQEIRVQQGMIFHRPEHLQFAWD
ncbi:cytochrome P450 [Mycobacterium stomatepiae]|uniref:Cytochrome P450 n=1 Tax=Mycobacterium stomatepiae TaxID=470076 RepID=A0A7I7QHM2_9MYCO|nr:cytochrome P450 [Mycobacterium stomatepiae]BBY25829.1 cytochrome P450 [Mycobacterium stomatepiae]